MRRRSKNSVSVGPGISDVIVTPVSFSSSVRSGRAARRSADGAPIGFRLLGERDHTRPANDQPLREQGRVAAGFALRCGISVPYAP